MKKPLPSTRQQLRTKITQQLPQVPCPRWPWIIIKPFNGNPFHVIAIYSPAFFSKYYYIINTLLSQVIHSMYLLLSTHVIHSTSLLLLPSMIHSVVMLLSLGLIHSMYWLLSEHMIHSSILILSVFLIHSAIMLLSIAVIHSMVVILFSCLWFILGKCYFLM